MKRLRILLASNNEHKYREIKNMFKGTDVAIFSPAQIGVSIEVNEDGKTYLENALKKAKAFFKETGYICLADDSGLEVSFLNNEPGIFSSRYAGEDATDEDRINKVLSRLKGVPFYKRNAKFVSTMVLYGKDFSYNVSGFVNGYITFEPQGNNGFGYDPIFFIPDLRKTMAQLSLKNKNIISHRSNALKQMKTLILSKLV